MAGNLPTQRRPGLYYGWWVVATVFMLLFLGYGARLSFGVFLKPMSEDLGWSITQVSSALSVHFAVYAFGALVMGRLTDKYGPRLVIGTGALLMAIGLLATTRIETVWQFYLSYGVLAGFGMGALYAPGTGTIAKYFINRRGLALGLAVAGCGVGPFITLPLCQYLITTWGWRSGFLLLGVLLAFGAALPFALLKGKGLPEDIGLAADGAASPAPAGGGTASAHEEPSVGLGEAMKSSAFWMWVIVYGLTALAIDGVLLVHLPAYLTDISFSPTLAAFASGSLPLAFAAGAIGLGALGDRVERRFLLAGSFALSVPLVLLIMRLEATQLAGLFGLVIVFGLLSGAIYPTIVGIAADVFGRKAMAGIVGGGTVAVGIGGAIGPSLAGYLRDSTSSYALAFWMVAVSLALACAFTLSYSSPMGAHPRNRRRALLTPDSSQNGRSALNLRKLALRRLGIVPHFLCEGCSGDERGLGRI